MLTITPLMPIVFYKRWPNFLIKKNFKGERGKIIPASAGNRTPINCLEGNYANHYTTVAVSSFLSDVLCIFFSKNTLLSHLHTADISFTYSNLPLVGITKLSESDLGEQKEYETH